MNLLFIVGARPNFVKLAPLYHELRRRGKYNLSIVHTGQHADDNMSGVFFRELELPEPDVNLNAFGHNATQQVSVMLDRLNVHLPRLKPDIVFVFGDVNSTLAGTLAGAQHRIPVAHYEAGLRSGDMGMMEEINRVLTDRLSVLHFVTEFDGYKNLRHEGVKQNSIHMVGNLMVDAVMKYQYKCNKDEYILATVHRAETSDNKDRLREILAALDKIARDDDVIFPIHPRTERNISEYGLSGYLQFCQTEEPFGYIKFLFLLAGAKAVITDSGGIQAEAWALGTPCITIRDTTEQKESVKSGANVLCKCETASIIKEYENLANRIVPPLPELWDGKTAGRIADILDTWSGN